MEQDEPFISLPQSTDDMQSQQYNNTAWLNWQRELRELYVV